MKKTPAAPFSKEREKLKYFEGVLRNVWVLRSVSYEIYQLFANMFIVQDRNVFKVCLKSKEKMKRRKKTKTPFQSKRGCI